MGNKESIVNNLKRSTAILAMTTLAVSAVLPTTQPILSNNMIASADEGVVVTNLDTNLKEYLNVNYFNQEKNADITDTQIASITGTLNLVDVDVSTLDGLEKATNISGLLLDGNKNLTTLAPLKDLSELKNLSLKNTNFNISDNEVMSQIKDLKNLVLLDASGTATTDVNLKELTEITTPAEIDGDPDVITKTNLTTLIIKDIQINYTNTEDTNLKTLVFNQGSSGISTSKIPTLISYSEQDATNYQLKIGEYDDANNAYTYLTADKVVYSVKDYVKDETENKVITDGGSDSLVIILDNKDNYENKIHNLILNDTTTITLAMTALDTTPPEKATVTSSNTERTTDSVDVSATFDSDSVKNEYRIDGGSWAEYTGAITVTENSTLEFKSEDRVGNVSDIKEFVVNNIHDLTPTATSSNEARTNQSIDVTVNYDSKAVKSLYKVLDADGNTVTDWTDYTAPITVENNGKVLAKSLNKTDVESDVLTFDITNIDKSKPTVNSVTKSTTEKTTSSIELTVDYSVDSIIKQYKKASDTDWLDYLDKLTILENDVYEFRGINDLGTISDVHTETINNIVDVTPTAESSNTELTNQDVVVTVNYASTAVKKFYKIVKADGTLVSDWAEYTAPINIGENVSIFAKSENKSGAESESLEFKVENIDKVAPNLPDIVPSTTARTTGNVELTANFTNDSEVKEYKKSTDSDWLPYTDKIVVTENETYEFRATDKAGNVSNVKSYQVNNIVDVAPIVTSGNTELTNQDVPVTITYASTAVQKLYKLKDDADWSVYSTGIMIPENTIVYAKSINKTGVESDVSTLVVNNIDKVAPNKPTLTPDIASDVYAVQVKITAKFDSKDTDIATKEYKFVTKAGSDSGWQTLNNDSYTTLKNGTIYVRAVDKAGNVSEEAYYTVENIDSTPPVIKIENNSNNSYKFDITDDGILDTTNIWYANGIKTLDYFRNGEKPKDGDDTNSEIKYGIPQGIMSIQGDEYGMFTVYAIDKAGNDVIFTFEDDVTGPQLTINKNNFDRYATISTTDTDVATVKYIFTSEEDEPRLPDGSLDESAFVNDYGLENLGDDSYTIHVPEEINGDAYLHVLAKDLKGNITLRSVKFFMEIDDFDTEAFKNSSPTISVSGVAGTLLERRITLNPTVNMDKVFYKIIPPNTTEADIETLDWVEYTNPFKVDDNVTILAKGYNNNHKIDSATATYNITDIENQKPDMPTYIKQDLTTSKKPIRVYMDFKPENKNYYKIGEDGLWFMYSVFLNNNPLNDLVDDDAKASTASLKSVVKALANESENEVLADGNQGVLLYENGTVYMKAVSPTGVESDVGTFEMTSLDLTPPKEPTHYLTETKPTNKDVTAVFEAPSDEDVIITEWAYKTAGMTDFKNGTQSITVSENQKIQMKYKTNLGVWSEISEVDITNIDKIAPDTPTITPTVTEKTTTPFNVFLSWNEVEPALIEYSATESGYSTWKTYDVDKGFEVSKNVVVRARITDKAGNVSEIAQLGINNFTNSPNVIVPTNPTDPIVPVNPTEPTDPTNPTNPTDPNNPSDPNNPNNGGTDGGANGGTDGGSNNNNGGGNGDNGNTDNNGNGDNNNGNGDNNSGGNGDDHDLGDLDDDDLDDSNIGKNPNDVDDGNNPDGNLPDDTLPDDYNPDDEPNFIYDPDEYTEQPDDNLDDPIYDDTGDNLDDDLLTDADSMYDEYGNDTLPQTGHEENNSTTATGILALMLSILTFGIYRRKSSKKVVK